MSNPVELQDALWLGEMSGTASMGAGRIAQAGGVYPAPDGHRLFYGSYGTDVIFFMVKPNPGFEHMNGKFFTQNKTWFESDIGRFGHYGEMKLAATKKTIENFMELYLGVLSVCSAPMAIAITGMNAFVTAGAIKQNWEKYRKAVEVLLYNRQFVKNNAATLYNVIWIEMLLGKLESMISGKAKDALLNAVPGPKVAGKIVGVFVGKLGEDDLKERMKTANTLFKDVLIKVADHAAALWPEKLSENQISQLAEHHVVKIMNTPKYPGYVDQNIAEKIVRETAAACLGLQRPLKEVSAALDLIK